MHYPTALAPTWCWATWPLQGHLRELAVSRKMEELLETQRPESRAPREVRACPIPSHAWLASGPESHEGHVLARHIPPRPPCPHATAANSSRKHILR